MAAHTLQITTSQISSDVSGFSQIARLHRQLLPLTGCEVSLDCSRLGWLDGHLAASLRTVLEHAARRGNSFKLNGLTGAVSATLQKNGFLPRRADDTYNTTIPLTKFGLQDAVGFSLFAKKHLQRRQMPRMTDALKNKFYEGIDELFANSALHSKSQIGVHVCGQFFPKIARIDFAIVDGGQTIAGAAQSTGLRFASEAHAIEWAMEPGNTTRSGDIPGGLGSKILREFVGLNGGKIVIASGSGFWRQNGRLVQKSPLAHAFPGTCVILEINTADRNKYDLVSAPDPRNIW